jgi:hypothetical protein
MICRQDFNLVISRKTIHERKDYAPCAVIDDLVDEGRRVVVLKTSFVEVSVVNANTDGPLFLSNRNEVGDPFSYRDGIDKARF